MAEDTIRRSLISETTRNIDSIAQKINAGSTADKELMIKLINRMLAFCNEFIKPKEEEHKLGEFSYIESDTYQVECPECGRVCDNGGDWHPGVFEKFKCKCGAEFEFKDCDNIFLITAFKTYWDGHEWCECYPSPGSDEQSYAEFLKKHPHTIDKYGFVTLEKQPCTNCAYYAPGDFCDLGIHGIKPIHTPISDITKGCDSWEAKNDR